MKQLLILIFLITTIFAQKISVLLDWKYQFEFAGYIAAKEKGFYKNIGLDVSLVEYHNNNIVQDVLDGKYDFGIYDNNLIIDKINNKPIKLVSSIFKRSALVLIVDKDIKTLKQLEYKTLMIANKDIPTFKEFLKSHKVDVSTIKFVPTNYSIEPFIEHKVNGFSAFITDEVYLLEQKNIQFNIINPSDYDFLMYQGELFTSDKFANKNPVLVDKFKKATIKGWYYALDHKLEIAQIIYNKYTKRKNINALLDEAKKLEQIIQRYIYPIGFINKPLLQAQFIYEANRLHKQIDVEKVVNDYIFTFKNPLNLSNEYLWIIKLYNFYFNNKSSIITGFISFIILLIFLFFYRKLQKQKNKIETLFNKATVGYILVDIDTGIVTNANEYALNMFGLNKNIEFNFSSQIVHVDERNFFRFKSFIDQYKNKYNTIDGFSKNWRFKKQNGEIFWANVKAIVYSETEALWIITDIDDIMKITEKLDNQIQETQKAMKVKEEFLANMSHEIRTPLNAILGFVDIILHKEKDTENIKYLQIISKAGKTLVTIINDILDFSKIESGKLEIEKIEFNPKEEFSIITSLLENNIKEKNINLEIKMNNMDYYIIQDPTRIKQVILNLLSNAIKFTPKNRNIYCNINYDDEKERLYVEVSDEGIGISEEKLKTIFNPFSQADTSTTRKYGGTGLGLAISKKLIKLLNGELKVESKLKKGSKFYFSIPAKKTKKIEKKSIAKKDISKTFIGKILIVEDNKANQMFFKVILNTLGLKDIDIANDGIEGIEKVKNKTYDIIFMDENMPNMNGTEATKKIKSLGIKTPIIAVTANALSGDKEKFLKIMDDYLSKPVEKEKLIDILTKYLKG